MTQYWQQGSLIEVEIIDLSNNGEGVGKFGERVVFVPDTVTGDRAMVRLLHVKSDYAHGKLQDLIQISPYRIRPKCIVADKCGGCQWQHVDENYQLRAKRNQIIQSLARIGGFKEVNVNKTVITSASLNYRNKATYPLGISSTAQVQAGYYRKNTHQLINLNQCPVQDERLNPLLALIKQDIQERGWSIYNEEKHLGQLRHLALRIGARTGEILLTLVSTDDNLPGIEAQAQIWLKRHPQLVGVTLNLNPGRTNVILGKETRSVVGRNYLTEIFAGLELRLAPETFFQINTEAAEKLLEFIVQQLNLQGNEVLLDAYCGIGTFTLPLAKKVKQVIGIESLAASVEQANINAQINHIENVRFLTGKVEDILPKLDCLPDIVLLDPPRKGCERITIDTLLNLHPERIVYVSCQSSTLARDLKLLCTKGNYQLTQVQAADFFPQTAHVECAAFLVRT